MTALDLFPTVDEQAERNIAGVRVFARLHGLLFEGDAYAWSVFSPCRTYRYLLGRQWHPDGACMRAMFDKADARHVEAMRRAYG